MPHSTPLTRRDSLKTLALAGLALGLRPATASAQAGSHTAHGHAPVGAGYYRHRIGSVELYIVTDGSLALDVGVLGGEAASQEEVKALLAATHQPTDQVPTHIHGLIIKSSDRVVLVDTGTGGSWGPESGHLPRNLAHAGIAPDSVTDVFITHCHPDHFLGCVDAEGKATYPNAKVHIADAEIQQWTMTEEEIAQLPDPFIVDMVREINRQLKALGNRIHRVNTDQELAPGVKTMALPGHTNGHLGLAIDSQGERHWFLADIAHNAELYFRHPDWQFGFDTDPKQAVTTRQTYFARAAEQGVEISGSHFPFPGLGHIVREGSGFRWLPALWQWS